MPTTSFMPHDDIGKAELLEHLVTILPKYAELLNISPAMFAALKTDSIAFREALNQVDDAQSYAMYCTAYKKHLRDGGSGILQRPSPPKLDESALTAVEPGIASRLSALAAYIKAQPNYTTAIGQETWLIGYAQTFNPSTWKPVLSCQFKAGHPVIVWKKAQAKALEIWVDRSDGKDFVFLAINFEPNTIDSASLPPSGTTALWKYKAIYILHDEQVGQWSDVLNVTVTG